MKKPDPKLARKPLQLGTEKVRELSTGDLKDVVGGLMAMDDSGRGCGVTG